MIEIDLEVTSDFICPWCYIGITRIERVLKELSDEISVNVTLMPYQLYPDIPKGGKHKSYFASKTKRGMGKSLKRKVH